MACQRNIFFIFFFYFNHLEEILPDRSGGLEAEPGHVGLGVVPGQGGQVDAGDGPQEPGRLTPGVSTPCRGVIRGVATPAILCHKEP